MKKRRMFLFGMLLLLISITSLISGASYWAPNSTINSSLISLGSGSTPSIFYKDSSWYLLSGNSTGKFAGFAWNGTDWIVNTTINSTLPTLSTFSSPCVFYKDESWYLISGDNSGQFRGYLWNGTEWMVNTTINSSLPDIGTLSAPVVFYKDSSWYLIGSANNTAAFYGAVWNGTDWISNSTIINGLSGSVGRRLRSSVFYKDSSWYLISGGMSGYFPGYNWNGTGWQKNSIINSSLPALSYTSPSVFYKDESWYLIAGESIGQFPGFTLTGDGTPPTYSSVSINNTVAGEPTNFAVGVNDNVALHPTGTYIFSTNNTGEWINDTSIHLEGNYTGTNFDIGGSGISSPGGITQNGTFFWIIDRDTKFVYKYYINGTYTQDFFDTSGDILSPLGITQNGTFFWITDYRFGFVYKYYINGTYTQDFFDTSEATGSPYSITHNGTFFWILDAINVYKFFMNGTYTQDSFAITGSGGIDSMSISQNNTFFWIIDSVTAIVDKYYLNGTYTGNNFNTSESGISNLYSMGIAQNNTFFYITDANTLKVYQYSMEGDTPYYFTSTPSWANVTKILNSTVSNIIGYMWYFNDSSQNTNSTPIYALTTDSDTTPPFYYNLSVNNSVSGQISKFSIIINDTTGLSPNGSYIFSTNNSGVWVNDSTIFFSSNPYFINVTKTLNSTGGPAIGYRWYFNDSVGNTNYTPIYNLNLVWADNGNLNQNVYGCGNLSTANAVYNLISPVTSTGTCFEVSAVNITLNCGNWDNKIVYGNISNTTAYYGIYSYRTNTTIRNCEITSGSLARLSDEDYQSDIRYGIYIYNLGSQFINANKSIIENSNVSGNFNGIYFYSTSNHTVNNVTLSANSNDGMLLKSSSYNLLNNITTTSNSDIGLRIEAGRNSVLNNIVANYNNNGIFLSDVSPTEQCLENNLTNIIANYNNYTGVSSQSGSMSLRTPFMTLYSNISANYNKFGVYLYASWSNSLINVSVNSNSVSGLELTYSSYNNLSNVNAISNGEGFHFSSSGNNTLRNTNISNNSLNFYLDYFPQDIDLSNFVNYNKKIYANYSIFNYTFDLTSSSDAGMILCVDCNNVTIKDLNLSSRNVAGVYFFGTDNSSVFNVTSILNEDGIYLYESSNNSLTDITSSFNTNSGMYLYGNSNNNLISNSTLNSNSGYGAFIDSSSNNNLSFLSTSLNSRGIYISSSPNISLRNNNMSNNTRNFYFSGEVNSDFLQDIDLSNVLDYNKKIYYNYSIFNYSFDSSSAPDAGMIFCVNCNNITIKDLILNSDNIAGVYLYATNNSLIQNTSVDFNRNGINLYSSINDSLISISTKYNEIGILLYRAQNNNLDNINLNSTFDGIYLFESPNNRINNLNSWNCSIGSSHYCILNVRSSFNNFENLSLNYSALNANGIFILADDNTAILNSSNNLFRNVAIENMSLWDFIISTSSNRSLNNSLINASYNTSKEFITGSFSGNENPLFYRKWYLDTIVNNTIGYLIDANVTILNASSNLQLFTALTNENGTIQRQELTEYSKLVLPTYSTLYRINVTKTGYVTNSTVYNLTLTQNINHIITLSDVTSPEVFVISPTPAQIFTTSTQSFELETNENSTCNYSLDGGITNYSLTRDNTGTIHAYSLSLSNGNYNLYYYCSDLSGNLNNTQSNISFNVNFVASLSGSGGGSSQLITINKEDLIKGYQEVMSKNWEASFKVGSNSHKFKLDGVNKTNVKIIISSETQEAILSIGQEKKFELSGDDYYDLLVVLNSISPLYSGVFKANITLKTIHEIVPEENEESVVQNNTNETPNNNKEEIQIDNENNVPNAQEEGKTNKSRLFYYSIFLVLIIIICIILLKSRKKKRYREFGY